MASPPPFVNRYISYPYQLPNYFWTYQNTPLLNPAPLMNSYPRLQYLQPFAQNYSQIVNRNFSVQQPLAYNTPFFHQYSVYNAEKQLSPKI
jgi:hypothetical protein